jgi:AMP-binding enzyme
VTSHRPLQIADHVPADGVGAREIGFAVPAIYNASRILFDNLENGNGKRPALTGPQGTMSYAELCNEASRWGHGLLSLGLKRGDRVLMFLDDTPVYPAAFFGAVRAGFVPLLINTLTPPDLLQFYLADSGATVALADAEFCASLRRRRLQGHRAAYADRGQWRGQRSRRFQYDHRPVLATGFSGESCGSGYASQRDGILDVFVGLDRPAQGHRPSPA